MVVISQWRTFWFHWSVQCLTHIFSWDTLWWSHFTLLRNAILQTNGIILWNNWFVWMVCLLFFLIEKELPINIHTKYFDLGQQFPNRTGLLPLPLNEMIFGWRDLAVYQAENEIKVVLYNGLISWKWKHMKLIFVGILFAPVSIFCSLEEETVQTCLYQWIATDLPDNDGRQ